MTVSGVLINVTDSNGITVLRKVDLADDDAIHAAVGGMVEAAPCEAGLTIFVNEDGKGLGLPRNMLGEAFWALHDPYGCVNAGDWMAGNALILGGVGPGGRARSAPDWVWPEVTRLIQLLLVADDFYETLESAEPGAEG